MFLRVRGNTRFSVVFRPTLGRVAYPTLGRLTNPTLGRVLGGIPIVLVVALALVEWRVIDFVFASTFSTMQKVDYGLIIAFIVRRCLVAHSLTIPRQFASAKDTCRFVRFHSRQMSKRLSCIFSTFKRFSAISTYFSEISEPMYFLPPPTFSTLIAVVPLPINGS